MAIVTTPSAMKTFSFRIGARAMPPVTGKVSLRANLDYLPWWRTDITGSCSGPEFWKLDRAGKLSGKVLDGDMPVPRTPVHLYYRPTGKLLTKVLSGNDGSFEFVALERQSADYFSVALYPNDNAQVFDKIIPV